MSTEVNGSKNGLEIAIVGGGICGVCCAIALQKQGIKAHVYEAAAKFGEIGAGIAFSINGVRILDAFGVLKDVLGDQGLGDWSAKWLRGEGDHELIYQLHLPREHGLFAILRSAFLDAVVPHVDPTSVFFKKRCISITPSTSESKRYTMHFADGTSAEADVVVLANGINCSVRSAVVGPHETNHVTYANKFCYRGLIPLSAIKAVGLSDWTLLDGPSKLYLGKDKHVIIFPVAGGTVFNVVAYVTDYSKPFGSVKLPLDQPTVEPATVEEILETYSDFGSDILKLLSCIKNPSRWNLTVVWPHLETYVNGGIALVGDAAHAMLPHIGAGGSQGLEDIYLLAQLLSHPQTTKENVDAVLKVYDEVRRPRSQFIWEETARAGRVYDGHGDYPRTAEGMHRELHNIFEPLTQHFPDQDRDAALKRLVELGVYQ